MAERPELQLLIRNLMRKYTELANDPGNDQKACMYGDVCGEFAEDLWEALARAGHEE